MHDDQQSHSETRKLQKVGGGTYTVSVPKEWATARSLSAGDRVHLHHDADGSLIVHGDGPDEPTRVTAAIDGVDPDEVERTLRAAYAAGVDELTLLAGEGATDAQIDGAVGSASDVAADGEAITAGQRRRIEAFVREHAGMRLESVDEASVTIRTILDDGEVSVRRTVVRLQFVTLSLFRTAVDYALEGDRPVAADGDGGGTAIEDGHERIAERRAEARRLGALVTRQFGRSLSRPATAAAMGVDRPTAFDCHRTAMALDRLAARSVAVARVGPDDGRGDASAIANADALRPVADAVRRYVEAATTAVVEADPLDRVATLGEPRAKLTARLADADAGVDGPVAAALLEDLEKCVAHGDRIAAVALEGALRRAQ